MTTSLFANMDSEVEAGAAAGGRGLCAVGREDVEVGREP